MWPFGKEYWSDNRSLGKTILDSYKNLSIQKTKCGLKQMSRSSYSNIFSPTEQKKIIFLDPFLSKFFRESNSKMDQFMSKNNKSCLSKVFKIKIISFKIKKQNFWLIYLRCFY